MKTAIADVRKFMLMGRQHIGLGKPEIPVENQVTSWLIHDIGRELIARATSLRSQQDVVGLRARLMLEELGEALCAIAARDVVETADGLADLVYVTIGTAEAFGIDLNPIWTEVQRSNLAKFTGCEDCTGSGVVLDGQVPHQCSSCMGTGYQRCMDASGKVCKPPGWTPPDIAGALGLAVPVPVPVPVLIAQPVTGEPPVKYRPPCGHLHGRYGCTDDWCGYGLVYLID